ncbi:protein PrsA [Seminavis robusta]|uniref:Peptidyl-prolyl cis-trans isomerase n=1 Tax=Seminavis robusta TaxID=568900 RepID=A0A9N8DF49_9STRA|nr:protein PrsA [Seminavis robusta]|eukprot:Sro127_g060890.1 protein PrsA (148) ;mRNA; f:74346-74874
MSVSKSFLFLALLFLGTHAFTTTAPKVRQDSATALSMAWLDRLLNPKSFPPEAEVTARHILIKDRQEAEAVKAKFRGRNFAQLAKQYSTCPSSAKGGNLGSFNPGQMQEDFDLAVFDPEVSKVGELTGPVMTPFGYHLIIVDKRSGV